jgi:predicted dehydrogenase/threonine dehydrogenase-like Zn-dependent dehydrogenase
VKQIAQYQDGRLELQDVPMPTLPPGGVLVKTTHSVISVGTEKMKVEQAKMNLLQKARARPDQVRKVLDTARTLGWQAAMEKVKNRLEAPTPLGYSAAGVIVAVDPQNTRLKVGDRVAVGGAECAFHAEFVAVPDMLVAKVPDGVENWQAAYTTIASIALQAVRQLEPRLGERVLVMGQGLVGLLVTAILRANGVRVMAVDVAASKRPYAEALGAEKVVILGQQSLSDEVRVWTEGYGVDAVVLCTATKSNAPIEQSAEVLRDRGRLVIVGNTYTELAWKVFYEKELEVKYSRSYGPGRYDMSYEWLGQDYPINYVRWTEQRNFEACLHLMRTGDLDLAKITTRHVSFSESLAVYQDLLEKGGADIGIVIEYGDASQAAVKTSNVTVGAGPARGREAQKIQAVSRLDVVGAGNFARTMLLPHLKDQVRFGTVVNNTSLSANHVKTKFGFAEAATDHTLVLHDDANAAMLIATRHNLHAPLVKAGLEHGRHVFVEKPLCLTKEELLEIDEVFARSTGTVQVGFNRRFATATAEVKKLLKAAPGPKTVSVRVMPGKLDPQSWYMNYAESGGRVLGEACHFVDLIAHLVNSKPVRVSAQTVWPTEGRMNFPDSVTAQFEFEDGSCGQLIYTAEGDSSYPKEMITVYGAGFVAEIENFQKLTIHRKRKATHSSHKGKGHAEQMTAWAAFLKGQSAHPLPYEQSRTSMLLTFALLEAIQQGKAVEL